MSGRLIILSKKGYCPWSAKNLARIERDEKEHQEAQERERNKQASLASNARLSALKKTSKCEANEHERFNLFEVEEKGSLERIHGHQQEKERKRSATEVHDSETRRKNKDKSHAANKYRDGTFGTFAHKNQNPAKAFYLSARPTQESLGRKEIKRIRDMDPMRQFHAEPEFRQVSSNRNEINNNFESLPNQDSTDSSLDIQSSKKGRTSTYETEEEKQKRKRKKHHRRDRSHKHKRRSRSSRGKRSRSEENDAKSLELQELREKRAERERRERQREKAILKGVQTPHLRRDES